MIQIEADSMDKIQEEIIRELLKKGNRVKPRGQWIYEVNGLTFKLDNPRARLIYNPERKYSLTFALGEFLWYLRGTNELDIMQYYNKRYVQFSDDTKTLYGAYGSRIFGSNLVNGMSQWEMVFNKLKEDPDTRQAIICIYAANDISAKTLDVPCTCYIQYFIRKNKLNCIVNMRSNDIIWGTAYDVFSFTMLQELLANMLHIEMGWYIHFAGSMHIYDRHLKMAEKILVNQDYQSFAMPKMPQNTAKSLKEVLVAEERIRLKGHSTDNLNIEYWRDILKVLKIYSQAKRGTKIEESIVEVPKYYRDLLVLHKSIYEKL